LATAVTYLMGFIIALLTLPLALPIAVAIRWYVRRIKLENIGEHRWFVRHLKTNYIHGVEGLAKTTGVVTGCLLVAVFPAEVLLGLGYGVTHLAWVILNRLGF
jgi:hypothetical protein